MRISKLFNLGATQPELDFVDVDTAGDTHLFIDPSALRLIHNEWSHRSVSLVQNFFETIIRAIQRDNNALAKRLLRTLREPNETHLGLSRERARGRGLGARSAENVWAEFSKSEALKSGLLADLEDTILMIDGIGADIVSDMVTNIIRGQLVAYTQDQCKYYNIPTSEVDSGPMWNPSTRSWNNTFVQLPVVDDKRLLLVPKAIVRRSMDYDPGKYFNHYVLERLRVDELSSPTSDLVQLLKNGKSRVTKISLREKYGQGKRVAVQVTIDNPALLDQYRKDRALSPSQPLDHQDFAEAIGSSPPNWKKLLSSVTELSPGPADAVAYEKAVEALLTALLYPALIDPTRQASLHEGRKRIDITYTNMANRGFFAWLSKNYEAPKIFVECKNYTSDPGNPELDQLAGRFGPSRGRVGLLVCRTITDKQTFVQRCRDTALDGRGFIIPLDDVDLAELISEREAQPGSSATFSILRKRFDKLIM